MSSWRSSSGLNRKIGNGAGLKRGWFPPLVSFIDADRGGNRKGDPGMVWAPPLLVSGMMARCRTAESAAGQKKVPATGCGGPSSDITVAAGTNFSSRFNEVPAITVPAKGERVSEHSGNLDSYQTGGDLRFDADAEMWLPVGLEENHVVYLMGSPPFHSPVFRAAALRREPFADAWLTFVLH